MHVLDVHTKSVIHCSMFSLVFTKVCLHCQCDSDVWLVNGIDGITLQPEGVTVRYPCGCTAGNKVKQF